MLVHTYNQYLKEDSIIKGIHPGDVKIDKCQSFIFLKKTTNKRHCSKILDGVIAHQKCIIEDNLDNYPKTKFKGKQAIEIVKEILGTTNENLEGYFIQETFDDRFANNNRAVEYDPQKMFLLMKKRHQEKQNLLDKNSNKKKEENTDKDISNKANTKKVNINNPENNNINEKNNENEKIISDKTIHLNEDEGEKEVKIENKKTKKKSEKPKKFDSLNDTMSKMMMLLNKSKKK